MRQFLFVLLLATAVGYAQTAPASKPATETPEAAKQQAAPANPPTTPAPKPAEDISPTAPVMTLNGFCPKLPAGTDPKSPECRTVVTRAEFEKLANTLAPNMPANAKQQLAAEYFRMLVLSEDARKMGLDKTERYNELMDFMKMRVLSQELMTSIQEKAKPTPAEVQKYYQDNQSKYEEISVKRVFIPRNHPPEAAAKGAAPKTPTDAELQATGDKARARLAAGESFEKVQKDVYEAAGFKTPPPPTVMPNLRRDSMSASQQALFEMKKGELSKVLIEPAGAYIYQVETRSATPFDKVKPEIEAQLTNERMRQQMEALTGSIKPEVNQAYFQSLAAADRPVHALTPPPSAQSATQPGASKPATNGTPKTTAPAAKKPVTSSTPKQ